MVYGVYRFTKQEYINPPTMARRYATAPVERLAGHGLLSLGSSSCPGNHGFSVLAIPSE